MTFLDAKTLAAAAAGDHPKRLRSCGKPTAAVRLALMDENGALLPPNQPGEIVARGSLVNPGYYNLPEATAETRTHGWHHTGDIGYRDEDGYFYIVDRKKDMIITGGFNVYPSDVEVVLAAHPAIADCSVVGIEDDKWGEAVHAAIEVRPGATLEEAELKAMIKRELGSVKTPKAIHVFETLPRSPLGKVLKPAIRDEIARRRAAEGPEARHEA